MIPWLPPLFTCRQLQGPWGRTCSMWEPQAHLARAPQATPGTLCPLTRPRPLALISGAFLYQLLCMVPWSHMRGLLQWCRGSGVGQAPLWGRSSAPNEPQALLARVLVASPWSSVGEGPPGWPPIPWTGLGLQGDGRYRCGYSFRALVAATTSVAVELPFLAV